MLEPTWSNWRLEDFRLVASHICFLWRSHFGDGWSWLKLWKTHGHRCWRTVAFQRWICLEDLQLGSGFAAKFAGSLQVLPVVPLLRATRHGSSDRRYALFFWHWFIYLRKLPKNHPGVFRIWCGFSRLLVTCLLSKNAGGCGFKDWRCSVAAAPIDRWRGRKRPATALRGGQSVLSNADAGNAHDWLKQKSCIFVIFFKNFSMIAEQMVQFIIVFFFFFKFG